MRMSDFSKSPPDPLFCMKVTQNSVPFVSWGGCAAASTAGSSNSARRRVFHPEPARPADNPFPFVPHRRTRRIIDSPFSFSRSFVQSGSPSLYPPQQEQIKPYTRIRIAACPAGCSCRISYRTRQLWKMFPRRSGAVRSYDNLRNRTASDCSGDNYPEHFRGGARTAVSAGREEGPERFGRFAMQRRNRNNREQGIRFHRSSPAGIFRGTDSLHRNDRRTGSIVTRIPENIRTRYPRSCGDTSFTGQIRNRFRTDPKRIPIAFSFFLYRRNTSGCTIFSPLPVIICR